MSRTFFSLHRKRGSGPRSSSPTRQKQSSLVSRPARVHGRFHLTGSASWQRPRRAIPEIYKQYGCTVATMVLSETRGLMLFRVIRGGIGLTQRLGAIAPCAYSAYRYSPSTPNVARTDSPTARSSSPEDGTGLSTEDVQATCGFIFSASKLSPFFHSVRMTAAILRASVSRAMVGFMPLASRAW